MTESNPVHRAVERINQARRYTLDLIRDVEDSDWFCEPMPGTTHLAWQLGHLAMAEYAPALMRVRDSQPGDRDITSRDFRRHFFKGSPLTQKKSVIFQTLTKSLIGKSKIDFGKYFFV